jgi:5'-nucleotidase
MQVCRLLADMIHSNGFGSTRMNILVSNDDGVYADGLWALVRDLREIATVAVVAPDRDQSGVGTSVTLRHPLRLIKARAPLEGVDAYSVEGTPADSVILALRLVLEDKADLVISGINEGPNLGDDAYISGTVGAALQGFFYGIPAIALSIAAFGSLHFDEAARLARLLVGEIVDRSLHRRLLLNVNLPNLPREKIEGIEITRLGERKYADRIEPGHDGKRGYHWIMRGKSEWQSISGTDIWALEHNKISITPLFGNPDGSSREILRKVAPELFCKFIDKKE